MSTVALALVALAPFALFGGVAHGQTPPEAPDVEIVSERLLLTRGPDGPLVLHMIQLVNVGPRPAERVPLSVLEGAAWLDVPEGFHAEADVLVDPNPMAAGDGRQYMFSYELPWQRLPMPIRRPLFYPTGVLEVWAEDGFVLRGVGLRAAGDEDIAGRRFTVYVSADLPPHPQWQVLLETTSGPGAGVSERERLGQRSDPLDIVRAHPLPGLLLAIATALLVGGVIARRRPKPAVSAPTHGDSVSGSAGGSDVGRTSRELAGAAGSGRGADIARLKELIVQLDVAFQNGELEEAVYVERRRALRGELLRRLGSVRGDAADLETAAHMGEESS